MPAHPEATWSREPTDANPVLLMRLATGPGCEKSRWKMNVTWLLSWMMSKGSLENPDRMPITLTKADVEAVITLVGEENAVAFVGQFMRRPAA